MLPFDQRPGHLHPSADQIIVLSIPVPQIDLHSTRTPVRITVAASDNLDRQRHRK